MPYTGKVAEIFSANILPHEGRQIYLGDYSMSVLKFSTYNLVDVAVLVPSDTAVESSFMCRSICRWLLRDTEAALKYNASMTEGTIILAAPDDKLDAIAAELDSGGASAHLIDIGSDVTSAVIIATIRAILMKLDEYDPSFRTNLSGETERLADLGIFNSSAGGDIRDVLLLASWLSNRMTRVVGNPDALNLLSFGAETPASVSALVDGWVDELFGSTESCSGLNVMPISRSFGDLLQIKFGGTLQDGFGQTTPLSAGGDIHAGSGSCSQPLEVGTRPKFMVSPSQSVPTIGPDGARVPLTEIVSIDVDAADGAIINLSDGADLIILELTGKSLTRSRSGEDAIVGFYNEEVSEWQYIDQDGVNQSVPILSQPYYCPDLNNASAPILRVFLSVAASSAPEPAVREIKLVINFLGPVADGFDITIRQQSFAGDLGQSSDMKWPTGSVVNEYGAPVERINFTDWQPSPSSSYAIYRIETFNHTLWDVDPSDAANETALTTSYGQARSLLRKFHAWRELSG